MRKGILKTLSCVLGTLMILNSVSVNADAKQLGNLEKGLIGAGAGVVALTLLGAGGWYIFSKNHSPDVKSDNPNVIDVDQMIKKCKTSIFWDPGSEVLHGMLLGEKARINPLIYKSGLVDVFGSQLFNVPEDLKRALKCKQIRLFTLQEKSELEKVIEEIATFVRCVFYNPSWSLELSRKILAIYVSNHSMIDSERYNGPKTLKAQNDAKNLLDIKKGEKIIDDIDDSIFDDIARVLFRVQCNETDRAISKEWTDLLVKLILDVNKNYNSPECELARLEKQKDDWKKQLRDLQKQSEEKPTVTTVSKELQNPDEIVLTVDKQDSEHWGSLLNDQDNVEQSSGV